MADTRKPLQLTDIPVMNFGKYVLESMKQFGDAEALVSIIILDFSLTVKAANLIFISWRGSAISSAKEGISGFIYNLVKS